MSDNDWKNVAVTVLRLVREPLTPGELYAGMALVDTTGTIPERWRPEERGRGVTLLVRRDRRFVRVGKRWMLAALDTWGN